MADDSQVLEDIDSQVLEGPEVPASTDSQVRDGSQPGPYINVPGSNVRDGSQPGPRYVPGRVAPGSPRRQPPQCQCTLRTLLSQALRLQ